MDGTKKRFSKHLERVRGSSARGGVAAPDGTLEEFRGFAAKRATVKPSNLKPAKAKA